MGKIAFVFSGQGAQYTGMGKQLYDTEKAAKTVFDTADSICPGTSQMCFEGTKEELSITVNTQPCLFCVDLAAALCLKEHGIMPEALAGFSLGEIAALTFCDVFTLEDGFAFVCKRAQFMHEETLKTNSTMVAVLKMPNDKLEELCKEFEGVYPVNYNGPGQTVVALAAFLKEGFCEAVRANGGRAMPLPVSAAFHSPYLDGAAVRLAETLKETEVKIPALPVYANLSARPYSTDVEGVKRTIAEQANHPVYWQKTIENMVADGIDTFVEVGAGKTLSNLIKKIAPQVQIYNVEDAQSLVETVAAIKAN